MADDFLKGDDPSETKSQTKTKNGRFIEANIRSAGSYNAYLKQRNVDRLDPVAKAKLEHMLKDIDDNLDELQREKEQYHKNLGSAVSSAKSGW